MAWRSRLGRAWLWWVLCLVSCGGGQAAAPGPETASSKAPASRQASHDGRLDWPALGGRELPRLGGGEHDAVVIVAIEYYAYLPEVGGAIVSADDWYDYFTYELGVPKSRIEVLKGSRDLQVRTEGAFPKPTAAKMKDAVERAAKLAASGGGRLWFVFIGHGAPVAAESGGRLEGKDGLLVDYHAEAGELTGLRHSTLMAAMEPAARGGQQPVAILDACYSGKLATGAGSGASSLTGGQMTEFKFAPPTPEGVLVLSAAASDQVAFPLPGLPERRPAFSYLLLGGLRGWADAEGNGDGKVTADEAIGFTQFALSQFGRDQRPQLFGSGEVSLVRAGDVPRIDVRQYANLLASGGAQPSCSEGFEWRDRMCRPQVSTQCDSGFAFIAGRGCVATVDDSCDEGFELRDGRCRPRSSQECESGYRFVAGRGCVPLVVAAATLPSSAPAASVAPATSAAPATSVARAPARTAIAEDMVRVPGGMFRMGMPDGDSIERPTHRVTLSSFEIDRTEVTVAAYTACVEAGSCTPAPTTITWDGKWATDVTQFSSFCNGARSDRAKHPINCIGWDQAAAYCAWRGARLPTEAEWEYAARGQGGRPYPWGGSEPAARFLNASDREGRREMKKLGRDLEVMFESSDGAAFTAEVGSYPLGASAFGALDMAGNVAEWVADWYGPYSAEDQIDPVGPASGANHVLRGGSWNRAWPGYVRATYRADNSPGHRRQDTGFRCARSVSP